MKIKEFFPRKYAIKILAFAWLFILMSGYYILKPLRGALTNELPFEWLPWLFIGVMVAIICVNFVYDLLARRLSSIQLVTVVTLFFTICLLGFAQVLSHDWPTIRLPFLGVQQGRYICIIAYFLFVGVYNVFTVTMFWSFINEIFYPGEARRWFGKITAGGTLGGLFGSVFTSRFVSQAKVETLIYFSVGFLVLTLGCMKLLSVYKGKEKREENTSVKENSKKESGLGLILGSRYLQWLVCSIFLMTSSATILSYEVNAIVKYSIFGSAARTEFWANLYIWINALGLFFQIFLIHGVVRYCGIKTALLAAPLVDLATSFFLVSFHGLFSARISHIGRYSMEYSFNRASREMLYTPTNRNYKYQAKAIIDTFVFRAGDGLTSLLLIFLSGWSLRSIAFLNLALNFMRIIPPIALARDYKILTEKH